MAQAGRVVATQALAAMLRYATFIQPPPIKSRDDHIIGTTVSLLSEPHKIEVKLKRRLVAALGETVFYVTAQEDDPASDATDDKWSLPSGAIDVLSNCLIDESDEIVQHYSAKVFYTFYVPTQDCNSSFSDRRKRSCSRWIGLQKTIL